MTCLAFQDIERHRYFNTNNLWLHLPTLRATLAANNNELDLPMIRNRKTVDPRDPDSTPVYQLETAMGSALAVFEGAEAIRVPRARFAPVKKTDDLLAVRSDAYQLTRDFRVVLARERRGRPPAVELDSSFYRLVDDLDCRFPAGPPSLRECDRLRVEGAFEFGPGVVVRGDVTFRNTSGRCVAVPRGLTVTDAVWPGEETASSLLPEDDGLKAPAL
jgi:UTP--glucose-1-phosphate uridylyltransferase